ncbi:hypothetical protein Tco_1151024 [Tanacetum coccineum]
MHTIGMTMKPLQVNTKFVKHLQPEWSKFVTDVKLAKDMHTTNFDHLYAHLRQHEAHENEVRLARQRYPDQIALVANSPTYLNPTQYYPQLSSATQQYYSPPAPRSPAIQQSSSIELDSGLVIPFFNPSDDLISNLNKLMAFVTATFGPHFPQTNNQLRTSSNPRNQATIQDGRVNCTKPKRPNNSSWFKEKILLTEALESGAYLDPEQLAFLADNGDTIIPAQASQEIPTPTSFQTDDLDAFMMYPQLRQFSWPIYLPMTQIYSNIVSYEQYLQETENPVVQSTSSPIQQDELLMSVIEEMSSQVAKCDKIHTLKLQLNATAESHKTLSKTVECLKKESKQKEDKYLDEVIDLQKKNKALDNVVYKMGQSTQTMHMLTKPQAFYDETHKIALGYQNPFYLSQARWKVPALYDGNTIVKTHVALSVTDSEETLELAEENKKYFEIEKKELSLDNNRLLEHIICQDVMNTVMHANVHSNNVLHANTNSLEHDNSTLELLKHENDRLIELLISQDLVHTANDKVVYNELSKRYFRLENRRISLEIKLQQSKERLEKLGVSNSTQASGSKPGSNTKKDRITQTSSSNKTKNKVEDQPMIAKSSLNNVNHVSKTVCNPNLKHSVLNANSKLICATYHECMFDAIHFICVCDYLHDVNARVKSQSMKSGNTKSKKKKM